MWYVKHTDEGSNPPIVRFFPYATKGEAQVQAKHDQEVLTSMKIEVQQEGPGEK